MKNLNKAMIIGNLTRDPDVRTTPSGVTVASFSVATNLTWKDKSGQQQERAEYHNVVAWRRLAEIAGQYLRKGGKVFIEGRLQTRSWDDKQGVKKYRTEIVAENLILLDRPGASSEAQAPAANESSQQPPASNETTINVEDIPF